MPEPGSAYVVPPELLNFYKDLKDIQVKYSTNCRLVTKKNIGINWSGDTPLIQLDQPVLEADRLCQIFDEISSLIAAHRPTVKNDIDRIAELPRPLVLNLLEAVMTGTCDNFGGDFDRNVNINVLKFIVINCVKPFLKAFAGEISNQADIGVWRKNFCPVCGNSPYIGRIKEDGKRYLCCSLCDTEWLYKRRACYNCGNENHETLSFILIEETPGYGLHVCEQCKGYLKVIDEQKGSNPELTANEAATIFLDVLAQQHGYRNDSVNT